LQGFTKIVENSVEKVSGNEGVGV